MNQKGFIIPCQVFLDHHFIQTEDFILNGIFLKQ
jgi:hypothetical protein